MRATILFVSSIAFIVFIGSKSVSGGDANNKRVQVLNGSPYVHLQHGLYFGKTMNSPDQQTYHAFLGIRYAAVPKRYERSVPMTDLDMMSVPLLAQSLGSECPQITDNGSMFTGKEDCLVRNIFTPIGEPSDKDGFPVIVFIHPSSGFKSGNGGAFDVSYFMTENVICATFNFRLGSLGFLSTEGVSNLGLYDQVTFLEWINRNIASFGGNRNRVTIAGIESGAASVKYLLLSPQSTKGLFQSAILHGGMMFSTFLPHQTSTSSYTRQFSDELECPHQPSHLLVDCLKTKRLKDIMRSQKITSELGTVEREAFTRWLVGVLDQIPGLQHEKFGSSFFMEVQKLYFREGIHNNSASNSSISSRHKTLNLGRFLHDIFVVYGLWNFGRIYATCKPVYRYLITFPETANNSVSDHYNRALPDGVEYLTPSLPEYHEFESGSDEEAFSRKLVHLWATFAIHQKPVDVWHSRDTWMPLSAAQLNGEKPSTWYSLNKEVEIIPEPFTQRMKFWDRMFKQKCK